MQAYTVLVFPPIALASLLRVMHEPACFREEHTTSHNLDAPCTHFQLPCSFPSHDQQLSIELPILKIRAVFATTIGLFYSLMNMML